MVMMGDGGWWWVMIWLTRSQFDVDYCWLAKALNLFHFMIPSWSVRLLNGSYLQYLQWWHRPVTRWYPSAAFLSPERQHTRRFVPWIFHGDHVIRSWLKDVEGSRRHKVALVKELMATHYWNRRWTAENYSGRGLYTCMQVLGSNGPWHTFFVISYRIFREATASS